jgi:hypothetical protein
MGEIVPPDEPHQADDPDQRTRRSVRRQDGDGKAAIVIDGLA